MNTLSTLTRPEWNEAQTRSVAALVLNPATNGGTDAPMLSGADILPGLAHVPALAAFQGDRAVFVCGLWPFDPVALRGILHVAGTGEYPGAWQLVKAFLSAMPDVEVLTFTDKPALIRLARRVGLEAQYDQDGYTVLAR